MAQILDKQGLQHYANKMCNADNRKVGSKSLPTALNEIDIAIDGFKTLFETEYGTPVNMELENNKNVFSVGTGTNVDKSSEVENSFTDVELSGNSLVAIFNLSYTTTNEVTTSYYYIGTYEPNLQLKDDVYYTLLPLNPLEYVYSVAFYNKIDGELGIENLKTSNKPLLFKKNTNITTDILFRIYLHGNNTTIPAKTTFNFLVLEGDWTNKPIPQYFEGMKSVGQDDVNGHKIEILSQNKNLFTEENRVSGYISIYNGLINNSTKSYATDFIKIEQDGSYTFSCDNYDGLERIIAFYDCNKNYIDGVRQIGSTGYCTFTLSKNIAFIRITYDINATNLQLEFSSTRTTYVEHKSDKKEISLNEPLRGLPNGIRDTIEKINGEWKIVRRCGEIIFDGVTNRITNYHPLWSSGDYHAGYSNALKNIRKKGDTIGIADKIVVTTVEKILAGTNIPQNKGLWLENYSYVVYFSIPKNEATGESVGAINTWLTNNNVKLIYQLETPTIEDISPVTLQCWKNGTISIDEVLPVETTHTVALNKSAQIQKNIEELTLLRNRVEALEKQYNNSTLNQAYELELLRLDMELDNIV